MKLLNEIIHGHNKSIDNITRGLGMNKICICNECYSIVLKVVSDV